MDASPCERPAEAAEVAGSKAAAQIVRAEGIPPRPLHDLSAQPCDNAAAIAAASSGKGGPTVYLYRVQLSMFHFGHMCGQLVLEVDTNLRSDDSISLASSLMSYILVGVMEE